MAASVTRKNKDHIRFNSGNLLLVKFGEGDWEGLGNVVGGKLQLKSSDNSLVLADGESESRRGSRKCDFNAVLAQTDVEVFNRLLALSGGTVKVYYNNGTDNAGETEEIYIPKLRVLDDLALDMKGNTHQPLQLVGSVSATDDNDGLAKCTPDTDLPDEAVAAGSAPLNSYNPYFVVLGTTAGDTSETQPLEP